MMVWKAWQIVLLVVFGTIWLVFFLLDLRRKSEAKKLYQKRVNALKADGLTDEEIKEVMKHYNQSRVKSKGGKK